ncbi:flagellar hook-associated protein 1 [mine drainage metagenome]|uniref:Flagellar hook-associated protein 1 n=1 Tax=mine drainage metagenome TaxID=410659 RepID=A0A1J5Q0X8_9ZZZZ
MSSFDGLSVALSSLYAQRRGLDVTGQNIANANTEGYSRQRVDMASVGAPATPAIWSTWQGAGGGVTVQDITRLRDAFLEARGRTEQSTLSQVTTASGTLNQVQQMFPEPGTNGLQSILSQLWSGFSDLANNPGSSAARTQVLQQASATSNWLNQTHASLATQWSAMHDQANALASEVNSAAQGVADLNQAIQRATQSGLPANDLADQRDLLAMKLANLVGATSRVGPNGMLDVLVGGGSLVRGNVAQAVAFNSIPARLEDVTTTAQVQLTWVKDGTQVPVSSGQAGAMLNGMNNVLPGYSARLDAVANSLATAVNTQHMAGFDLNGNPGTALFSSGAIPAPITAANITVAITNPTLLAASGVVTPPIPPSTTPVPNLDGTNAMALSQIRGLTTGPDTVYRQLVVDLGVTTQSASRQVDTQKAISSQVDSARSSQAGVNIDEEMTNMISYQRAYEAAGRLMSAIDGTLDTLINHTGLVGR